MHFVYFIFCSLLIFSPQASKAANGKEASNSILFEANKIKRNRALGYIDAIGKAQFEWRNYNLLADRVRYFENKDLLQAFGNITLKDPSGIFWFAQKATLENDWQTGNLENVAILFGDNSRLSARRAKRDFSPSGLGKRNQMRYATYSPCKVCKNEKNYPLWQISASKITHYEKSKTIYYSNVFLEFFGVPVFYIPFFAHPDPSVKRRSGILTPSIFYSNRLGGVVEVPITIDIVPQTSLIITPLITNREGAQLEAAWRHATPYGIYNITASVAHDYEQTSDNQKNWPQEYRAHIFSNGDFSSPEKGHLSYNLQWASDDIYLEFFHISPTRQLNSNIIYQHSNELMSLSVSSYYIRDLIDRIARPDLLVLPHIEFSIRPELLGGQLFFETDILSLLRSENQIDKKIKSLDLKNAEEGLFRFSTTLGWQDDWVWFGNAITFHTYGRFDLYQRRGYREDGERINTQGRNRALGLVMLEWRYPLIIETARNSHILEPIAQLIYAPYKNQNAFPNEDSQEFYFSDSNLFSANRFPGIDKWESGPRANLGFHWEFYPIENFSSSFVFGKVFRLKPSRDFESDITISGISGRDSDFVGRWDLSSPYVQFSQTTRLGRKQLAFERYDAFIRVAVGIFSLTTNYSFDKPTDQQGILNEASVQFGESWRTFGRVRYDLARGNLLNYSAGIAYTDECFIMNISFSKKENQARPEDNDFRVGLQLTFTNLGEVNISSLAGGSAYDN